MYVITNREIHAEKKGLGVFGRRPNDCGPNELRLVRVTGSGRSLKAEALEDKLDPSEVEALVEKFSLSIDPNVTWYASLKVACDVFAKARSQGKDVLVYVHGYNNDLGDVLRTAQELQRTYNLIVIPFSWPADGGGAAGVANYLGDKDDARISDTALNRTVKKIHFYHRILTEGVETKARIEAVEKHPRNNEKARALYSRIIDRECKMTLNLLCHSMGNYVLKYAIKPSSSGLRELVFDNVNLVAADVNNPGHKEWVETIPVRNRLNVFINEDDGALKWSRRKPGDAQRERLGNYLRNLTASNAYYLDVTRSRGVGSGHSYFKGSSVRNNNTLKQVFSKAFEGGKAEVGMEYYPDLNLYRTS